MKTLYFNLQSEVTAYAARCEGTAYRTRMECGCKGRNSRRNGVLIVLGNKVTHKLIRCKACRKGGAL